MPKRKLRASAFIVSDRTHLRLRTDGLVVARHNWTVYGEDVNRTVRHAVESARLEGVSLDGDVLVDLVLEAAAKPVTARPNNGRREPRAA